MNGKEKAKKVKAEIAKKKSALIILQSLNGKALEDMTKSERVLYDRAIGQLLGVLDLYGKVRIA